MKNKGFTLIELLAVIVILAIIALIATPIILNIINDSKKQSNQRSAELYLKAAELAIARENLNGEVNISRCDVITKTTKSNFDGSKEGDLNCGGKLVKVDIDGTIPTSGTITFTNGKITNLSSYVVGNTTYKLQNGSLVVNDSTEEETEAFTGTIYRNSSKIIAIDDSIEPGIKSVWCGIFEEDENSCDYGFSWDDPDECVAGMADDLGELDATCINDEIATGLSPDSYYTDDTELGIEGDFYLKHDVVNNLVKASYVCFKYSGNEEPACIQGGVPSAYGSFDGMTEDMETVSEVTGAEGNIAEIAKTSSYFLSIEGSCQFGYNESECRDNSDLNFIAESNGSVGAGSCIVRPDGAAFCW